MSDPSQGAITAATRYCAVFGQPIRHSASPAMQNAGIAALGLDWRYLAFEVPPGRLPEAIAGCRAMKFVGLNLTVPHKILALGLVDELDASARQWGAVNTIRFEGRDPSSGGWRPVGEFSGSAPDELRAVGFNTDADAVIASLEEDLGLAARGLKGVILGAGGGAGRVAALRLASGGAAELHLLNRTRSKAEEVAAEITHRHPATRVSVGYPSGRVDLILNATSLGLKPADELPVDTARFPLQQAASAYDMVYRPAVTPFLSAARGAGCRTANGLGMLLHQGAKALELWSGRPAPANIMKLALQRHLAT